MDRILLVATPQAAAQALAELQGVRVLGFDTESKPTFLKGEVSDGPHVVQFAVANRAWVFQLHDPVCRAAVADLLASTQVTKVGFGLDGDRTQIIANVQYTETFRNFDYGRGSAVAMVLLIAVLPVVYYNIRDFAKDAKF